ncbi:hypothetical protein ALC53_10320 [Atta colombica]|uniref:Uncharacterized protein n=1 Tax=Atta colombica TaxID=520822 RepID=A0A195B3U3_9HYME|nr:hypothetical protein ALC53_10320 [Atta colombica]
MWRIFTVWRCSTGKDLPDAGSGGDGSGGNAGGRRGNLRNRLMEKGPRRRRNRSGRFAREGDEEERGRERSLPLPHLEKCPNARVPVGTISAGPDTVYRPWLSHEPSKTSSIGASRGEQVEPAAANSERYLPPIHGSLLHATYDISCLPSGCPEIG